jgi:hypothetical protein
VLTTGKKKSEEKDKTTTTMDSSSAEEQDEEDDSEDDEVSDAESEGFDVPEIVEKDPVLLEKFEKVKKDITDDLPTMENILTTPMRKRNRKILFEWYHIYQNLMPCSQDRMEARMMIKNLYDEYKRDFKKFLKHKDEIKAFEKVDAIVTPTTPTAAFKAGEKSDDPLQMYLSDIFTISCNLAGIPGISVPCGFTKNPKLPIGLQLLGQPFGEESLLKIAHAYEQNSPWHKEKAAI